MIEHRSEQPLKREKTFIESAKLAMKRFYYKQLDPRIIVHRIKRWRYSGEFSPKGDSAASMLMKFVNERFDEKVRYCDIKDYADPHFRTVAYWFLSNRLHMFKCTRRAINADPNNAQEIKDNIESFIYGFETNNIGWSFRQTSDGFSQLLIRDGGTWFPLETGNLHTKLARDKLNIKTHGSRHDISMDDIFKEHGSED